MKKKSCFDRNWKFSGLIKLLKVMKLTVFLLLVSVFGVLANKSYSQSKMLNLNMREATIKEVLSSIEKQSEFYFLYSENLIDIKRKINITLVNQKIDPALKLIFEGTDVDYSIRDRIIVLTTPEMLSEKIEVSQQQKTVSGKVTDSDGQPLPGVTVVVKGTTQGTVTNVDGEYSIANIPENTTLVFSFVGMRKQEINTGNQTVINVTMEIDAIGLEEVVAVGYGVQQKATLTGSVSQIDEEKLVKSPAITVGNTIQGLIPGLVSMQRTGDPGDDLSTILVRGQSTTGHNSPLVLVDGVPEPDWQRISSNDIESISVLKDASASIYGVQAANGVILITTKRGTTGKPTFNFTYNQGITQPTRIPEMADAATLAEYANEYLERTGGDPLYTPEEIQKYRDGSDPIFYPNTNWAKETLKNFSTQSSSNINVRGGTENVRYSLSGSYQHQGDIIKNGTHDFKNYTVRSNIDALVNDNLTLSLDINASLGDRTTPRHRTIGMMFVTPPNLPVYYPGGYPSSLPSDQGQHPMINNTGGSGYDNNIGKRFSSKFLFDLNIPFVDGLGVDGYFFYTDEHFHRSIWSTPWTYYAWDEEAQEAIPMRGGFDALANLEERYSNSSSNLINLRIKYERQFEDHYVNAFLAVEQSKGLYKEFSGFRRDYMAQAIDELFAGADANQRADGYSAENARRNFLGRLSYNFQEKYLIDFNFRYDGSYRFPKDNRWGFFPGISVAYRISEENFMSDSFFDNLKLRASYGEMGNDAIDPFQFLQSYNLRTSGVYLGTPVTPYPAIWGGVSPNPNVTWEVATVQNIGLDALILDQALELTVDVFKQRRSNILTTRALEIPKYTGLILPAENIGIVDNKGVELTLNYRNKVSVGKGFTYSLGGNFAYAKNNVVDVSEAADVPEHQKMQGHILGAGLYYRAIGIFRTQEEVDSNPIVPGTIVGDLQYFDYDGDKTITANDRIRMDKSIHPEINYGFNGTVNYADFSLYAQFSGVARAWWWIYDIARPVRNAPAELLENRYTPGSMDSKYPWIPTWHPDMEVSGLTSDFWVKNASFLRLKTLELSYVLPQSLTSQIAIKKMRVYLSGSNLFTISGIKNYDPEGANPGTYYGSAHFYPQTKVYNLGVQLTF